MKNFKTAAALVCMAACPLMNSLMGNGLCVAFQLLVVHCFRKADLCLPLAEGSDVTLSAEARESCEQKLHIAAAFMVD